MLAETSLDPQEALVCTMVLVAAAGEAMTDSEIGVMSGLVQTLPVFRGFSADRLAGATDRAVELLRETDGLAHAGRLIRDSLPPRLRETAYALACEVAAADFFQDRTSVTILEAVRDELALDPLVASAIERGARARYQVV
ncbi:MAG TPA: tellurite resistance TerB family protein [Acetobacteraceae bacterium]|jgi:tellurite resistance protein|nr:tellurite resistance TerB family protein [Acetobacteraceae bacterium]